MNKEELELVIQAIEKLGNAGQSAFMWWLICDLIKSSLGYIVGVILICVSWPAIKYLTNVISFGGRVLAAARKPSETCYDCNSEEKQETIIHHIKTNFK